MDLLATALAAAAGLLGGLLVPRLIAWCPEPAVNPEEDPADFPDHVPFAQLAARPGLGLRSALVGGLVAGVLGTAIGWGWALPWLVYLVPIGIALAVIDYVTWYLPSRLIVASYGVVLGIEVLAAIVLAEPRIVLAALIGAAALGLYYGLLWFISPAVMAFGDVRLAVLLGLALGPFGFLTLIVSIGAAALLAVLAMVPLRRSGHMIRRKVPYGPFLLGGALVAVLMGQVLGRA